MPTRAALTLAALVAAGLCALIGVGVLVFLAGNASTSVALAAMVAASLLALVALAIVRQAPSEPRTSVQTTFAVEQPSAMCESPCAIIDRNGAVVEAGSQTPLKPAESLLDRVHLADRIAFMRAVASLRAGECRKATLHVRFNDAGHGQPQRFGPTRMVMVPERGARIAVVLEGSSSTVADPIAAEPAVSEAAGSQRHYLATVSHELRTPLTAIIGFSDLLRTRPELDAQKRGEYTDMIHGAATHLLSVVNAFLDVSKIEAGRYPITRESFDLSATVRDVMALIGDSARAKSIHVNLHIDDHDPEVCGDRRAVKQILINLVSNAVKFTPEGGCVTIDAAIDGDAISLNVSDTGIGMDADALARIGQPFTQIDNTYTRHSDGSGLGLALVKGLTALHGGDVLINSTPDIGTSVCVTLPLDNQPASGGETDSRAAAAETKTDDRKEEWDDASRRYG